jgi:hypothetical protein
LKPSPFRDQIQTVLSIANFQLLQEGSNSLARTCQDKAADADLSCTVDLSSFTYGFNNVFLGVSFSDHVYWVSRIQHIAIDESKARRNATNLLSEITAMRTIKDRTSIPVPQVFAYNVPPSNEVGYPYILMEHLPKVTKQVAEVLFQLHGLTFDRLGRLWCGENGDSPLEMVPPGLDHGSPASSTPETSLEWFYTQRQQENWLALKAQPDDPKWRAACWVLKTDVPYIIIAARVHGLFPAFRIVLYGTGD